MQTDVHVPVVYPEAQRGITWAACANPESACLLEAVAEVGKRHVQVPEAMGQDLTTSLPLVLSCIQRAGTRICELPCPAAHGQYCRILSAGGHIVRLLEWKPI